MFVCIHRHRSHRYRVSSIVLNYCFLSLLMGFFKGTPYILCLTQMPHPWPERTPPPSSVFQSLPLTCSRTFFVSSLEPFPSLTWIMLAPFKRYAGLVAPSRASHSSQEPLLQLLRSVWAASGISVSWRHAKSATTLSPSLSYPSPRNAASDFVVSGVLQLSSHHLIAHFNCSWEIGMILGPILLPGRQRSEM